MAAIGAHETLDSAIRRTAAGAGSDRVSYLMLVSTAWDRVNGPTPPEAH